MSGHSKWAKIKRQKAGADKKKGQLFSKLSKAVSVAARAGGDPETNPTLRLELDRAKKAGMTQDTILRAIKKGTGEDKDSSAIEEVSYEAYGPEGVGLLIQAATDNRNRTSSDIKQILRKFGGELGNTGSVSYLFSRKGQILVPAGKDMDLASIQLQAIDLGAEDVQESEDGLEIVTSPKQLEKIKSGLESAGAEIDSFELAMVPQTTIEISDENTRQKVLDLIEALEESEDVIAVHTNLE